MAQIDPTTLAEFKSAYARGFQRMVASDKKWDEIKANYEACKYLLAIRKKLQAFARRCEDNPERFCEVLMGNRWSKAPTGVPSRQIKQLTALAEDVTEFCTSQTEMSDVDARQFFRRLQSLAAGKPGRKPSGIYLKARALRQATPRPDFHEICLKLNPVYSKMKSHERRAEREKVRSGLRRLEKMPTRS